MTPDLMKMIDAARAKAEAEGRCTADGSAFATVEKRQMVELQQRLHAEFPGVPFSKLPADRRAEFMIARDRARASLRT